MTVIQENVPRCSKGSIVRLGCLLLQNPKSCILNIQELNLFQAIWTSESRASIASAGRLAADLLATSTSVKHIHKISNEHLNYFFYVSAINIHTGEEVAIKLEQNKAKHPQLHIECRFYKVLQSGGES